MDSADTEKVVESLTLIDNVGCHGGSSEEGPARCYRKESTHDSGEQQAGGQAETPATGSMLVSAPTSKKLLPASTCHHQRNLACVEGLSAFKR